MMTVKRLNNFTIRKAENQDVSKLLPIMLNYMIDFSDEKMHIHFLNEIYNDSTKGLQFVAEKDNKIVGFATLYFTFDSLKDKKIAVLHDLFVIPECRMEKVNQTLFETCLKYIRENDFLYMICETTEGNSIAKKVYQ
ncbi:GNAT family N-acetyltransferase [Bacillus salipaludis]|uniref:GNAT family N-acetyltransferase n=1 Tax=Bacillus salipaludis TaxID=2547811 RepID=UPI002E1FCE16|nr:GNAT family N-acetyltransferase [Bacillus salipaludis]